MAENDSKDAVRDMVDNIVAGKSSDALDQFNSLMRDRTNDALDAV